MKQPGTTCDYINGCQEFTQNSVQYGVFGFNHVNYEDGNHSTTFSVWVFYISIENYNLFDFSTWGAGLSFSFSSGTPGYGSGTASFDIDFLGLIRDQFLQGE